MKKFSLIAVPAFAVAALLSLSVNAASVTSTATVTIKAPITITETTAMSFGTVIPNAVGTAATVVLGTTNNASSGDATITGAASGEYAVTGAGTAAYTLSGLTSTTMTGTGAAMALTFTSSPAIGASALVSGAATILVGGSLAVGANQLSGDYTGSYDVTVNYN